MKHRNSTKLGFGPVCLFIHKIIEYQQTIEHRKKNHWNDLKPWIDDSGCIYVTWLVHSSLFSFSIRRVYMDCEIPKKEPVTQCTADEILQFTKYLSTGMFNVLCRWYSLIINRSVFWLVSKTPTTTKSTINLTVFKKKLFVLEKVNKVIKLRKKWHEVDLFV